MYAIVYKSDGFPICCQMDGVTPDPVVIWSNEGAAKAFIESKGATEEFQALEVTDPNMENIAKAIGCAVEQLTMEPYPG